MLTQHKLNDFKVTAEFFQVLANPIRLQIVLELLEKRLCVHELTGATGVSQPLVSQHLRVLRLAKIITGNRNGKEIIYEVTDDHVSNIIRDALEHVYEETS
ncbi:MAG: metalloregulator ArsR/SmtB family transcription factor [Actinomycetota bacterium]|nr:metalloregulator ArsR/SmtB family transcription factor [Actinomycetota bacterium]